MKREVRLFDEIERFAKGHWLTHALALTYGYDGEAGYDRIWKPLIERFGLPKPVVVADGAVDEGRPLGVKILRASGQTIFHPKLFIAIREDAALVTVGSANLTKGGLGGNLELLTGVVFGRDIERSGSRAVLEAVASFLEGPVRARLSVHEESFEAFDDVCRALRIVADPLPVRSRPDPVTFVHSGERRLFDQLLERHADTVEHALVVSPFWEMDARDREPADSAVHTAVESLPWALNASEPRCRFLAGGLGTGLRLPKEALQKHRSAIELRLQALSKEPRRLHAKLVALFGAKRTTVMWGSPNFTPAALLRPASAGGNVECALVLSTDAKLLDEAAILEELDLKDLFEVHDGEIPEPVPGAIEPMPAFLVGELHYEPRERVLSLCGTVTNETVRRVIVRFEGEQTPLLDVPVTEAGPVRSSAKVDIERVDEAGLRQLRSLIAKIEVFDAAGALIEQHTVRPNVAFTDALEVRQNILLGADALSADALLVPPFSVPERRVAIVDGRIEMMRAAATGHGPRGAGHQPSLDSFYKNVRRGLDARRRELDAHRGSRFGLLRWSQAIRSALDKSIDGALDPPRLAYFVTRVSEHIVDVLDALPKWRIEAPEVERILEPRKIADALGAVQLEVALHDDFVQIARDAQTRALQRLGAVA